MDFSFQTLRLRWRKILKNEFSKTEKSKPKEKDKITTPSEQLSISSRNRLQSLFNLVLLHTLATEPYIGWERLFSRPFSEHIALKMVFLNKPSLLPRGLFQQQCLQKHTRLESKSAYNDLACSSGMSRGAGEWLCLWCPQDMVKWNGSTPVRPSQTQCRREKHMPRMEAQVLLTFGASVS